MLYCEPVSRTGRGKRASIAAAPGQEKRTMKNPLIERMKVTTLALVLCDELLKVMDISESGISIHPTDLPALKDLINAYAKHRAVVRALT